jgi:hypothetical protein
MVFDEPNKQNTALIYLLARQYSIPIRTSPVTRSLNIYHHEHGDPQTPVKRAVI